MPEKNQRHGLPVPGTGTRRSPSAPLISPGSVQSFTVWDVTFPTASVDLVAIAPSPPYHAATFTFAFPPAVGFPARGLLSRPRFAFPPAVPGRAPEWPAGRLTVHRSDRLGGGPDGEGGQDGEDAEPGHQADGQARRHGDALDHVGADLHGLVGRGERADVAEETGQREPQP